MPVYNITSPTGEKYKVTAPEGATEDEILAYVQKNAETPGSGYGKALGSGAAEGLIGGITGIPELAARGSSALIQKAITAAGGPQLPGVPAQSPSDLISKQLGVDYEPQTKGEQYAKSVAAGTAGMALGPWSKAAPILGAASGALGQLGEDMSGTAGRLFGSIAPFLATAAAKGRTPNPVRVAKTAVGEEGEGAGDLADAIRRQGEATSTLGKQVTLGQASENPMLRAIEREIQGSTAGRLIQETKAEQGPAGAGLIEDLISTVGGQPTGREAANAIQRAGEAAAGRPAKARSATVQKYLSAAGKDTLDPAEVRKVTDSVSSLAEELNLAETSAGRKSVLKAADRVREAQRREEILPEITRDLGGITGVRKVTKEAAFLPTKVLELKSLADEYLAKGDAISQAIGQRIMDGITKPGSYLDKARKSYAKGSKGVEEVEQSALGRDFVPEASRGGGGDYNRFRGVLKPGKNSPEDIAFIAERLNRESPEAWPSVVRNHLEQSSIAKLQAKGGRAQTTSLGDFATAIRPKGGEAHFDAMMEGVAKAQGVDPGAFVDGANKMLDTLQLVSREQSGVGRVAGEEIFHEAGRNPATGALKVLSFAPFTSAGNAIERWVAGRTYKQIAEYLTTPEGGQKLLELSRYSKGSEQLKNAVRALVTGGAVQSAGPENQPAMF